jgi:hypothetical protein
MQPLSLDDGPIPMVGQEKNSPSMAVVSSLSHTSEETCPLQNG